MIDGDIMDSPTQVVFPVSFVVKKIAPPSPKIGAVLIQKEAGEFFVLSDVDDTGS